ncbi:MAG: 4Fe-4S binding protein [candidate division Zixibacteria bacterium]|nr:4Fe-4S binding protein [Gammaproteobacteria bacterium]NIX54653.1 4Fe-4S binding protein [candidate division Zixibacteria bacterium]
MSKANLLRFPILKWLFVNRWPQFLIRLVTLAGFLLAILGGFIGTPVGSRNISIVLIWIAWWGLLILFAVPILGRGWCNICPIPLVGEWLQQGTILGPAPKVDGYGLNKTWPKKLRNIWIQNGFFLGLAVFSTLILTNPLVTSIAVLGLFVLSIGLSLIFERRAFCRYICPVSGFIGLYSQVAPVEVRVIDPQICRDHTQKTCYTGNENGYGCPWGLYPAAITKNVNCGTCMECLRACPYDNMAVNLRPLGEDLFNPRERKMDEALKSFIMLGSAVVYSFVMLGPWGEVKMAAYSIGTPGWFAYTLTLLALVLVLLPGMLFLGIKFADAGISKSRLKREFVKQSYALVPLGLSAWIAFSLSFVFANFSYVLAVISDPFGWGWNLLGTASMPWTPYLSAVTPPLQSFSLLVGLSLTILASQKIARESDTSRSSWPLIGIATFLTVGQLWILIG